MVIYAMILSKNKVSCNIALGSLRWGMYVGQYDKLENYRFEPPIQ